MIIAVTHILYTTTGNMNIDIVNKNWHKTNIFSKK